MGRGEGRGTVVGQSIKFQTLTKHLYLQRHLLLGGEAGDGDVAAATAHARRAGSAPTHAQQRHLQPGGQHHPSWVGEDRSNLRSNVMVIIPISQVVG